MSPPCLTKNSEVGGKSGCEAYVRKKKSGRLRVKEEFLPGCLTEHPVHHLVCFSVGISMRSYKGCWIHAVFLAEIFSGCYDLLLNGRETVRNIYIYIYVSLVQF